MVLVHYTKSYSKVASEAVPLPLPRGQALALLVLCLLATPLMAESRPKRESWTSRTSVEVARGRTVEAAGEVNIVLAKEGKKMTVSGTTVELPSKEYIVPSDAGAELVVEDPKVDVPTGITARIVSLRATPARMAMLHEFSPPRVTSPLVTSSLEDTLGSTTIVGEGYSVQLRVSIECAQDAPVGERLVSVSLPQAAELAALVDAKSKGVPKMEFPVTIYESDKALQTAVQLRLGAEERDELNQWTAEEEKTERDRLKAAEEEIKERETIAWPAAIYIGLVVAMPLYFGIGYSMFRRVQPQHVAVSLNAGQQLPPLCVRCGRPAAVFRTWRFGQEAWSSGSFSLEIPWCNTHRHHRTWIGLAFALLFAGGFVAAMIGTILMATYGRSPALAMCACGVPIVASLVLVALVRRSSVHPKSAGSFSVSLVGVSPEVANQAHSASGGGTPGIGGGA